MKIVKEVEKEGKKYYVCTACNFAYIEKEWAEKCQAFCEENKSCSLEITKHAVKIP